MEKESAFILKSQSCFDITDCVIDDQRTKLVDSLFSPWDNEHSPGCACAIIKDGKITHKKGYGMADLERNSKITPETVFDIGSMSKQFVGMSILLLEEEGKLSLNDDIRIYIPEIPKYKDTICIYHLIHHMSGIRDFYELMILAGLPLENYYSKNKIFDIIIRQKSLNIKPGKKYLYSNTGYFLLGEIVSRISGKPLGEFVRENIFMPLGMNSTLYYDDFTRIVKNRAIGYFTMNDGGYGIGVSLFDVVGDGGVLTTVEDLFRWDQNFFNNKLGSGSDKIIQKYLKPGILNNGENSTYMFGLIRDKYRGLNAMLHRGGWAGYRSWMIRFQDQKFSIIILSNLIDFEPISLTRNIADIYLNDQFPKTTKKSIIFFPNKLNTLQSITSAHKKMNGFYRNIYSGEIWIIEAKEGKLEVKNSYGEFFTLFSINRKEFQLLDEIKDIRVTFLTNEIIPKIEVKTDCKNSEIYEFFTVIPLTAKQLDEYVGYYLWEELDVSYTIFLNEINLVFQIENESEILILEPTIRDEFMGNGCIFRFIRNKKGNISKLIVDGELNKKICFRRKFKFK